MVELLLSTGVPAAYLLVFSMCYSIASAICLQKCDIYCDKVFVISDRSIITLVGSVYGASYSACLI